ncbi:MAG: Crp/Fnr family transcriptional regulator [Candidatus Elarobacter sp.]
MAQAYEGGNRLIDALPRAQIDTLIDDLQIVTLVAHEHTQEPGRFFDAVDFPIDAVYSLIAVLSNGDACEVGTVGCEGFVAAEAALGETVARRTALCRIPGRIARMKPAAFARALTASPELSLLAQRNVSARLYASEQFTTCNSMHTVVARCARWLLMTRDRVGRDDFPITQDFLATMLGVRRAGVTQAAKTLRSRGGLQYHRGCVTIVNASVLREVSCECYQATRDVFEEALLRVSSRA